MGGCVSIHRHPDSNLKLKLSLGSKTDKLVTPSPVDYPPAVDSEAPIAGDGLKSKWSPTRPLTTVCDFGSKEETFFDSQAWLDSDCDDDFFSVRGDFTPSCGSTPIHQKLSTGAPQINVLFSDDTRPEPSPKKRLSELFKESLSHDLSDQDCTDQKAASSNQNQLNGMIEANGTGTPYLSGANSVCSGKTTPNNGDYRPEKEKLLRAVQCCLPRMLTSHGLSDGRKKMSTAPVVG